MLKRFEVSNYKNFKEPLIFDLGSVGGYQFNLDCVSDSVISKALIYGRNATVKTNLGNAITDISKSVFSLSPGAFGGFLNADSEEESATFDYLFQFGDHEVRYRYCKFSSISYKSETLYFDGDMVFDFDYQKKMFKCENMALIEAETITIKPFLDSLLNKSQPNGKLAFKLSFLKWLFANAAFSDDSIMAQLRNYIDRMNCFSISSLSGRQWLKANNFIEILEGEELQHFEEFLNAMGVERELVNQKLPDGQNKLYFKHKKLVPFMETASSGTLVLYNLYQQIVNKFADLSFIYLDEFDAFFHYEMSELFFRYLKKTFPKCQIVLTTHNTNLMTNKLMRPDCFFILSTSGKLTALCNATPRELREGHNLEKMYISGEFAKYE